MAAPRADPNQKKRISELEAELAALKMKHDMQKEDLDGARKELEEKFTAIGDLMMIQMEIKEENDKLKFGMQQALQIQSEMQVEQSDLKEKFEIMQMEKDNLERVLHRKDQEIEELQEKIARLEGLAAAPRAGPNQKKQIKTLVAFGW